MTGLVAVCICPLVCSHADSCSDICSNNCSNICSNTCRLAMFRRQTLRHGQACPIRVHPHNNIKDYLPLMWLQRPLLCPNTQSLATKSSLRLICAAALERSAALAAGALIRRRSECALKAEVPWWHLRGQAWICRDEMMLKCTMAPYFAGDHPGCSHDMTQLELAGSRE